jgi:hypothetical protein
LQTTPYALLDLSGPDIAEWLVKVSGDESLGADDTRFFSENQARRLGHELAPYLDGLVRP